MIEDEKCREVVSNLVTRLVVKGILDMEDHKKIFSLKLKEDVIKDG